MSVHYRFKSARDYDTITFDGLHISIKDLKNAIVQQKKIGKSSDFDLRVTNAQTEEVYEDDSALIPKNTSLLIARIPVSTPKPRHWEGYGGNDTPPAKIDEGGPVGKAMDLANLDAPEDDKIKAMMSQSTQEYDPSNYQKIKGSNQIGPVPPGYRCYKCHHFGHWIKDCPSNKTGEPINDGSGTEFKKSTGIPRDFMIPVDGPKVPGAMLLPNGTWAVPALDMQAYNQKGPNLAPEPAPKPEIPEDLLCSICSDLLADAVMIPCCGNSFCDECIRSTLLESEDRECPDCHEKDVSPATLIPNRFLRKSVATFKNTTGYEKAPRRAKLITEINPETDLPKQGTPPPVVDSTENGMKQEDKTVISEADSTEQAKAAPEFGQDAGLTPTDQFLQPPYRTPEQPPGCSPLSDFNSPQHVHKIERVGENKERYGERPDKYHYTRKSSRSPSPDHQRRRRSRSGSPRVKSARSPPEAVSTPTRDEMQAAMGPPPGFMPPRTEAPPHGVVQSHFNATGIPPGMGQVGHMQGPPMNMPPGFPPMGQQPHPHMGGFPQQGPPPTNFGMPPPGVPPPGAFMPGSYPMGGMAPSGHPPFNPQLGPPPPNFGPPTSNNPPSGRGREFSRSGRNKSPPKVIDDPLEAFNRIIAEKDERRARRARQAAAAARKSWSRSPSPGRRSYSRSPPPMRRRIGSRSPPPRRRSRSRSFTSSRSRSRSFSKSPPVRRKASPLRRQSPPPLRGEPPPRRGGPPPSSQHYRSPPHDRGRASPPPPIRRGGDRKPERDHDSRDYRDNRGYHDDRPPGRDYRDKQRGREPNRRGESRERHFEDRNSRDYRGNGPPPQHTQWANQNRDGPNQWAAPQQQHQGYPGAGMNRYQPRNFGPPLANPMPPNMPPTRRFDDIRPPGVEEPPIPGLESEPPVVDEFKKKPERHESPRVTYSPKIEREKERDKEKDRDKDRHSRRSRTPEFRNPSPKEDSDKHKRRRSKSSESSHKKRDKDYSEDEKKSRSKDKKKKDKKEKEKKKKDKKEKHKKDKDKKAKEEFRQVIPKHVTTDDEEEEKSKKKKKSHKEADKSDNEKLSVEAKKKEERRLRFIEDEKRRKAEEAAKKQAEEEKKLKIQKELHEHEEKDLEQHVNTEMNLYSDILAEPEVVSEVVTDMFEQEIPQSDQIGSNIEEFRTEDNLLEEQQGIGKENYDNIQEQVADNNFVPESNYIQDNDFIQDNNFYQDNTYEQGDNFNQDIVQDSNFVQEEILQNAPTDIPQDEGTEDGEIHDEVEIQNESVLLIDEDPSILELHSSADMSILESVENENLVPLPEKSKWETDEDGLIPNSPLDSFDQKDNKKDKIDKDVIKRAENAIFAKAINAIKPREIEIKRISSDRAKLYSDEKLKFESKDDVIIVSADVKPKVSLAEKPKIIPEKPRIPVKARLGIKIEDDLSPFSRRERRVDLKDLRRRERSKSPRFRKEVDLREKRMLDSKSRNDKERFKERKDKSEDRRKERKRRSRSRSSSSEPRKKKKDKKSKKEKDKKKDEKDGDKGKTSATEKRKATIDESNFEPDYDLEIVESEAEKKSKKAEKAKESKSDSSDSSSSSSEEERKKKKKKRRKKRKRSTSSSDSDSSSDSSDSERERKKRKHKKSKKKKKKNKHK